MAVEDTIRTVLGIVGNVISCFLFLSPLPTFYNIVKWKDTRGFSGFPYVMTILNCAMWVLYGMPFVKPHSILVVTINGFGLVVEIVYTTIFMVFCKDTKTRMKLGGLLAGIIVFFVLLSSLSLSLEQSYSKRATIIGTVCIVFNIIMYASPLSIMWKVIREKSVKYMPFYLSLACTLNGLIWTAYGCIHFDQNLVVPNGLGSLFGACQLILYAVYHRTTDWSADAKKEEKDHEIAEEKDGIEMKNRNISLEIS